MELSPQLNNRVAEIANDRLSGASTITIKVLECLDAYAGGVAQTESEKIPTPAQYFHDILTLGKSLVAAQPAMAPVTNAVNEIVTGIDNELSELETKVGTDPAKQLKYLCTTTQSTARKYLLESRLALESIAKTSQELIGDNDVVMTISASSVVEALFQEAINSRLDFSVFVPESRPMYEGRKLATRLAGHGLETTLVADSAMFHYLNECSKVIVGADRVMPSGVMNKIGTYGLALAAGELGIPFYCACECNKFIPEITQPNKLISEYPENQLYFSDTDQIKPEKLAISNIYFDITLMKYITGFFTEDGLLTGEQVIAHIENIKIHPELIDVLK